MKLARILWPSDRWRRVRNVAFQVFAGLGLVLRVLPVGLAAQAVSLVGLLVFTVFIVYAYETWRRDRPHNDTYSGEGQVLVHCSDPEQHDRHHPEDVGNPNRWLDQVAE